MRDFFSVVFCSCKTLYGVGIRVMLTLWNALGEKILPSTILWNSLCRNNFLSLSLLLPFFQVQRENRNMWVWCLLSSGHCYFSSPVFLTSLDTEVPLLPLLGDSPAPVFQGKPCTSVKTTSEVQVSFQALGTSLHLVESYFHWGPTAPRRPGGLFSLVHLPSFSGGFFTSEPCTPRASYNIWHWSLTKWMPGSVGIC